VQENEKKARLGSKDIYKKAAAEAAAASSAISQGDLKKIE
jgi:hypothetical protein